MKFRIILLLILSLFFTSKPTIAGDKSITKKASLGLIRFYQTTLSSQWGAHCNFYPSCSRFGYQAIDKYGLFWGSLIISDRFQRCHPGAWGRYPVKNKHLYDPAEDHYFGNVRDKEMKDSIAVCALKENEYEEISENIPAEIGFANKLMEDGDYSLAIIEFQRCLSNETRDREALILYNIGLCYYKLGNFASAIKRWDQLIKTYPEHIKSDLARYSIGCVYFLEEHYSEALQWNKELFSRESIYFDKAFFMAGISLIKKGEVKEAETLLTEFSNKYNQKYALAHNASRITSSLKELSFIKKKSPLISTTLSIVIPGTGQMYCGRLWDGLLSMGINIVFGLITYNAFRDQSLTREIIFAPLFLFFYTGNVYGAYGAAKNHKNNMSFLKLKEIERNIPYNTLIVD